MKESLATPLKKVHFAWALPIPENINPQPFYRITFENNSSLNLKAAFDGEISTRTIHNYEALFFRLYGWDDVNYYKGPGGLAIVFRPDFIRVVYSNKSILVHNPHSLSTAGVHILQALDALAEEKDADQTLCCNMAKLLLEITLRDFSIPVKESSHAFNKFLEVKHFIANNFDNQINREATAEHFGMTPGYISKLFKLYSDCSFIDYLIKLRLDKVEYLLLNSNLKLSKIAEASGFSSDVRLIKSFRQHYGTSPARFRLANKHRANLSI